MGPQLIDRYGRAEPGSELYNKSDPFKNPSETLMRMGGAALGGGLLSKLPTSAAGLMQSKAPAGSQGMIDALANKTNGRSLLDTDMMALAKPDAIFLHCLPADRGYEVTGEVIDGPIGIIVALCPGYDNCVCFDTTSGFPTGNTGLACLLDADVIVTE